MTEISTAQVANAREDEEHEVSTENDTKTGLETPAGSLPLAADEGCLGTQRGIGRVCHCPSCEPTTQPAGEHHTGTLNLTGEGNKAGVVSDAIVEDAAQRLTAAERVYFGPNVYAPHIASMLARAALEAAAPAIRQQVAEEIATTLDGCYASDAGGRGTYEGDRFMRLAISQKNRASGLNGAATVAREIGGTA